MVDRYLTRKEEKIIDKDDGTYIVKIGSKYKIKDAMDAHDRSISFGRKHLAQTVTRFNPTTEGIRWALDAAGNAGITIKFLNDKIEKQKSQIKKFTEFRDTFDREIALLKGRKIRKIPYNKEELAKYDARKLINILDQLLLEKRITQRTLRERKNELSAIDYDVKGQESEIEHVRKFLIANVFDREKSQETKNELEAPITQKYSSS